MPAPKPFPCGGEGQPACPPVPATAVSLGDVIEIDGQKYVLETEDDPGQNETNEDTAA